MLGVLSTVCLGGHDPPVPSWCLAAPVYIVNGAGGNREGNDLPDGASWTSFRSREVGFGYITITGSSSMLYQFVAANGTTLYEINITK